MRFRATIQVEGKTATGIPVPTDVVDQLGKGKRPPVRVTIGGHTYRSTVAAYGDVFMLPLSAENREAAGVAGGDEVDVDVELDTEPRTVQVPKDFTDALAAKRRRSGSSKDSPTASSDGTCCRSKGQRRPRRGNVASTSRSRCCAMAAHVDIETRSCPYLTVWFSLRCSTGRSPPCRIRRVATSSSA